MKLIEVDRRQLLVGSAATALISALPRRARAGTPKKGGHFKIGVADYASQDSLDPANSDTRYQLYINWQLRNCLTEIGPGGKVVPELAESWEGSADAKTWAFTLRKGVTFHDGKTMTAKDVIYSYNMHIKEGSKSSAKPLVASIASMKADGDNKIIFELSSGNVGFPAIVSNYSLLIVPDGTTDFSKGNGTGGYMLEDFKPGISAMVKRNPNYWKADRAHFDSVELVCIKDATARMNALISGEIHAYNFVDPKTVNLLKSNDKIRIEQVASKAHYVFPMLTNAAPFDNNDVRMAMKYAIDREDMVKRVLHGLGTPGNDHPINAAYADFVPGLEQRSYDPDKAKFHLKKAGLSDFAVQLFVSETPFAGATDAAVVYKEHAAKAGINIEVVKTPEDGYWDDIWTKKPICASRWSGRSNVDAMLSLAYTDEGIKVGWNETFMNNDRVNKLVLEARAEFDAAKRAEKYGEVQKIINEEGGALTFAFADFVDASSAKIAHDELANEWDLDGGRASERWWFA